MAARAIADARRVAGEIFEAVVAPRGASSGEARAPDRTEVLLLPETASSAKPRSRADWKRSSGFFSRQRRTSLSIEEEALGSEAEISGGSSLRMADMVSTAESPWKARWPVIIS